MKYILTVLLLLYFTISNAYDTGILSPVSNGGTYNDWTNPAYAYSSNDQYAIATDGMQQEYGYIIPTIPSGSIIDGFSLAIEGSTDEDAQTAVVEIEISWDGGTTYTTAGTQQTFTLYNDVVKTFGDPTSKFGRTWSVSECTSSNLKVRIKKVSGSSNNVFIDYIPLIIYYSNPVNPSGYNPSLGNLRIYANNTEIKPFANYVLTYVNDPNYQSSVSQFTIYNSWDFESLSLDASWDENEMDAYFGEIQQDCRDENCVITRAIVSDTINGIPTKVLRIKNIANDVTHGFGGNIVLGSDYGEIYASYNWKFSNEFNSTSGGKLPGLLGLPEDPLLGTRTPEFPFGVNPRAGYGPYCLSMFKQGGRMISYHYDNTIGWSPWSFPGDNDPDYLYDSIYFSNGTWYNITQRLKVNTFTEGVANADGIKELWVDGRMIFKETGLKLIIDPDQTVLFNAFRLAHFYGGDQVYAPLTECYGYIDNIKVFAPTNDATLGTQNTHNENNIFTTPNEITDRTVYYDQLITSPGTFQNNDYGHSYYPCIDEATLIDAGPGKTVSYTFSCALFSGDYLFFYDGDKTDSRLIKMSHAALSNQTVVSTGRYMFVRFSTDKTDGNTGFSGTITFN